MSRRLVLALLTAGLLGGTWHALRATSVQPRQELAALVSSADLVFEAQVLDRSCALLADGRVETTYALAILTPMKGTLPAVHELRLPGGEVPGRGMSLPGLPRWEVGERLILFLSAPSAVRSWRLPLGLGAGVFRVLPGNAGSARVVAAAPSASGEVESHDYQDFVDRVLREAAGPKR